MIAYDGLPMPKDIQLDKQTKQQIHIFGSAVFSKDGRTLKVFRHDLNPVKNQPNSHRVKLSVCG